MGCCASTGPPPGGAKGAPKAGTGPGAKSSKSGKPLNPKDYIIDKRKNEAIVKEEGSIDGQQFNIEDCEDCDIFLFDHIAATYVDNCERCRIFVGPVESSIMIRNCKACNFVMACQQFRSRDCSDCTLALFCTTEPIIETSTNMQFACFDFSYFSLRNQMSLAGLTLWNNKWSQVYDFNKNEDKPNWKLFPQTEVSQLLKLEACAGVLSAEEAAMDRVVPVTLGSRPWPSPESCFVVFLPESEAHIEAFMAQAEKKEGWALGRTRSTPLDEEKSNMLFAWAKDTRLIAQCKGKEITGIEVCGPGIHHQVREGLKTGLLDGVKSIRVVPEEETPALSKAFFETWKDEV